MCPTAGSVWVIKYAYKINYFPMTQCTGDIIIHFNFHVQINHKQTPTKNCLLCDFIESGLEYARFMSSINIPVAAAARLVWSLSSKIFFLVLVDDSLDKESGIVCKQTAI